MKLYFRIVCVLAISLPSLAIAEISYNLFERSRLIWAQRSSLPEGFREARLLAKFGGKEVRVGTFYAMNPGRDGDPSKGRVHFFTKEKNSIRVQLLSDFEKVAEELRESEKEPALMFAAAFPSKNPKKEWEIQGMAVEESMSVGQNAILNGPHNVIFEITAEGHPVLIDIRGNHLRANRAIERIIADGGSLFQQIPVILDGERDRSYRSNETLKYRFYVEWKEGDEVFRGVINFEENLPLKTAIDILLRLEDKGRDRKIVSAVSLHVKGYYEAAIFDRRGKMTVISDFKFRQERKSYTNLLVFYTDAED